MNKLPTEIYVDISAAYFGKTKRHLNKVRVSEHMGVSLAGKKVNTGFQSSAMKYHMLVCDRVSLNDFSIFANSGNNFVL